MDLTHAWRIVDNTGTDLSDRLAPYLRRIEVRDRPGRLADEVTIDLFDDPPVELPPNAKALDVYLGSSADLLVNVGRYYLAEIAPSSPPDTLTITGRAVYFGGGDDPAEPEAPMVAAETRSAVYEDVTLEELARTVAGRLGITEAVDPEFGPFAFDYLEQTRESDPAFITRAAELAGAIAKIAAGFLVVGSAHSAESYTEKRNLPVVELAPEDVASYSGSWDARRAPGTVRAAWYDPSSSSKGTVTAGSSAPVVDLRRTFRTAAEASQAAEARLAARARGKRTLDLTLTKIDLRLWVGSRVDLSAQFRPGVAGEWAVKEADHELSGQGGRTRIRAERI